MTTGFSRLEAAKAQLLVIDIQERLRAAGVVVTTVESAIFEMLERAGTPRFRRILPIVR